MADWKNRITGHDTVEPTQLLANPKNWRIHPQAQQDALAGVLDTVGWVQQVIVNERTGFVVDGHLRVAMAISEGAEVPVVYVDISEDEEALILASLDPLAAMAATDRDMLGDLLNELRAADEELAAKLDAIDLDLPKEPKVGLTDPDDVPAERETEIERGDLFALGDNRLMCGDATSSEDVERLTAGQEAKLLWTDPPYGVAYEGAAGSIKNDDAEGLSQLLLQSFSAVDAVMAPGCVYYIAHADVHAFEVVGAVRAVGWVQARPSVVTWLKNVAVLGRGDYHSRTEPLLYGWKAGKHHRVQDRKQDNVWEIARPRASEHHPTTKPIELIERALRNSTDDGDLVLDPFLGSGSTLIAAERQSRACFGMEIEPKYVQVAIDRWEAYTGEKAQKL